MIFFSLRVIATNWKLRGANHIRDVRCGHSLSLIDAPSWGTCADSYPVVSQSPINITGRSVVNVLFYACNPKRDYWALSISSPETALPLSSGKDNRRSVEELKTGTIKSWVRFNCPMREIVYPFDQEKFPGEFCFARTLHWYTIVPKHVLFTWPLIYVSRNLKGLLRKPKNLYIYLKCRDWDIPWSWRKIFFCPHNMITAICKFENFSNMYCIK